MARARSFVRSRTALGIEMIALYLVPILGVAALITPFLASSNCDTARCEAAADARLQAYWTGTAVAAIVAVSLLTARHRAGVKARDSALTVIAGSVVGWVALFSVPVCDTGAGAVLAMALGMTAGWAVERFQPGSGRGLS